MVRWLGCALFLAACSTAPAKLTPPSPSPSPSPWGLLRRTDGVQAAAERPCDPGPLAPLYPDARWRWRGRDGRQVRSACVDLSALPAHERLAARVPALLAAAGLDARAPCDWSITVGVAPLPPGAALAWRQAGASPERYAVVTRLAGGITTRLVAPSERAALYALEAALALAAPAGAARCLAPAALVDFPSLPVRGIVEGWYGNFFTPDERITTLRLFDRLRLNTYLYGPKNDPYSHDQWYAPYPPDAARDLADAAAFAHAHLIDFAWAVSPGMFVGDPAPPGGSISYASDGDFTRLSAKIEQVRALGVTRFALFLDDVNPRLVWPADALAFANLAEAQLALINRLAAYLRSRDPHARLLAVANEYNDGYVADAKGYLDWRAFNRVLARADSNVDVMWTGPADGSFAPQPGLSPTMRAADMAEIDRLLGRPVVIWDNWPFYLQPLDGRSADLPATVAGLLSNSVLNEQLHPTRDYWQVLGTVGDYAWNTAAYQPASSFARWQSELTALAP